LARDSRIVFKVIVFKVLVEQIRFAGPVSG
jgi:hypothetical protein